MNVLVIDDEPVIREFVSNVIKNEGYNPIEASNGEKGIGIFSRMKSEIDLVILDVMMPGLNGWEVLREIREYSEVPVIMLTALKDEKNEVLCLKKGADDFISKPFDCEVFIARVNLTLRRVLKDRISEINAGDIRINQANQRVVVNNSEVELNRKEYSLLLHFIKNKNVVLSRSQILFSIWDCNFDGDIRTVDTHVKTLRSKLSGCGKYIKTVRGSGYMFELD